MELRDRLLGALFLSLITSAVVLLVVLLTDAVLLQSVSIGFLQEMLIAVVVGLLLFPLYYWLRVRMEHEDIQATRVTDLDLNERDLREAVDQWVYIHYGKKAEGSMDFTRDEDGAVSCRVTVRDDR